MTDYRIYDARVIYMRTLCGLMEIKNDYVEPLIKLKFC